MQAEERSVRRELLRRRGRQFLTVGRIATGLALAAVLLMLPTAAYARVTEIIVDDAQPLTIGTPPVVVPGYRLISRESAYARRNPDDDGSWGAWREPGAFFFGSTGRSGGWSRDWFGGWRRDDQPRWQGQQKPLPSLSK